MSGRRAILRALAIAIPALLLGAGWLAASLRERASRLREEQARLDAVAAAVRSAIDEGLEDLRRREDERPFYLYHHYYSPPEVLAISDPVAVSPLAAGSSDPRILGWFQVDPDGTVRTPFTVDPDEAGPAIATRVRAIAASEELADLRALVHGREAGALVARARDPEPSETIALADPIARRRPREPSARVAAEPVTIEANTYAVELANDIQQAQAGDYGAYSRVAARGRQAPVTVRRSVHIEEIQQQGETGSRSEMEAGFGDSRPRSASTSGERTESEAPSGASGATTTSARSGSASDERTEREIASSAREARRPGAELGSDIASGARIESGLETRSPPGSPSGIGRQAESEVGLAVEPGTRSGSEALEITEQRPSHATAPSVRRRVRHGARPAPGRDPVRTSAPPLVPTAIEVDYTPMAWRARGDVVALSRVVSHEGAAVLQGVVLDRDAIEHRWIPEVIARIAANGAAPRVLEHGTEARCAMRTPASTTIDGLDLCFETAALAARIDALDTELRFQLGALAGLVLAIAAAAFTIHRASRRAEELAQQRSAFVSAVSHELRTPLTTIRMHAEMLEEGLVEEARKPRVFREIAGESVRLSHLVENVLEISRLEEGRRPLRASRGDLAAHVGEIVRQQAPLVAHKRFEVRSAESGGPIEASFDAQAIEQIVVNLIDNAVKYGASPIEVEVVAEGDRAQIRVRDHGPGIPAAEREKVFQRFHRVDRPESAHKPGTGIGLALVRDLARAHGGDAEARGREGGGCELRVSLPRA